ncbi:MAG: hypothetical protein ACXVPX_06000 [Actinomycetota bacterium]
MARRFLVPALGGLVLVLGSCSSTDDNTNGAASSDAADDGASVSVTEKDFAIAAPTGRLDAGKVTFRITNAGPSVHEFVVFKTDLDEDNLPMTEDQNGIPIVDEEGEGVEPVDEVEDIANASTESLSVDLEAGNYVAICNLPAHYQQGMHTSFTVE